MIIKFCSPLSCCNNPVTNFESPQMAMTANHHTQNPLLAGYGKIPLASTSSHQNPLLTRYGNHIVTPNLSADNLRQSHHHTKTLFWQVMAITSSHPNPLLTSYDKMHMAIWNTSSCSNTGLTSCSKMPVHGSWIITHKPSSHNLWQDGSHF